MRQRRKPKALFLTIIAVATAIAASLFVISYKCIWSKNVETPEGKDVSVFIATYSDFQAVEDSLCSNCHIIQPASFKFIAKRLNYVEHIRPGHYIVRDGMSNIQLINMLRFGKQTPVKVIFNNIRTVEQLAGKISSEIEADSLSILNELRNDSSLMANGFNQYNYASIFIPNTYEFYWNTDAKGFLNRMKREYKIFWDESRLKKAESKSLTPLEVSTLASIVDKETSKTSEMRTIAGVYLNRLKKKRLLQADPTLVFATGDYGIHRVLNVHKEIDSPYNTYKHLGLPPGPICIPSIAAIDAVLNAEDHKYLYFCAKDDLSGYHVFAKTLDEHNANAERYRRALNKNRIYK